jgi:fermentation-respiration switch protein FrsA (DUF1100 family)
MTASTKTLVRRAVAAAAALSALGASAVSAADFSKQAVSFQVGNDTIRADLYLPAGASATKLVPAVVVGGSLTSVKEQMSATYARELASQGVAALAIDYRHYGQSSGQPRQLESTQTKKADLQAAAHFLRGLPVVQPSGVSLLGICTSGGNVIQAAAEDRRLAGVVTIAGWFAEPSLTPLLYGGEAGVAALRQQGAEAQTRYQTTGTAAVVQTYGMAGSGAAHAGDHMDYYVNPARGRIPAWTNAMAVQSWGAWLDFNPVASAARVTVPTMIIHSDDSAFPDQARKVHGLIAGPKELTWLKGGHFEFYDNPAKVQEAATHVVRFVRQQAGRQLMASN